MKESILRKGSQATGFKLLLALTLLSFNGLTANRSVLTLDCICGNGDRNSGTCNKSRLLQKILTCKRLIFAYCILRKLCAVGAAYKAVRAVGKRKGTRLDGVPVFYTVHL